MLVVMIGIRKALDLVFTRRELKILDDIMPEMTKRAAADDLHHLDAEVGLIQKLLPCLPWGHRSQNSTKGSRSRSNNSNMNGSRLQMSMQVEKELEAQKSLLQK